MSITSNHTFKRPVLCPKVTSYHNSECWDFFRILTTLIAAQVGVSFTYHLFCHFIWKAFVIQYGNIPQFNAAFLWLSLVRFFNTEERFGLIGPQLVLCLAGLPDVVVDGVLQGLYPRDVRVSFTAPSLINSGPVPSIVVWNVILNHSAQFSILESTVVWSSSGRLLLNISHWDLNFRLGLWWLDYEKSSWNWNVFTKLVSAS